MVEIYASESSNIGRKVNWNHASKNELSNIDELDVAVLKEIYSEIVDFASKLEESNRVMNDYKDDEDILDAISENEEIIKRKKETIKLIEARFEKLNRQDLIDDSRAKTSQDACTKDENDRLEYL